MPKFTMLVEWIMVAEMEFEAATKQQAIDMAYDASLPKGDYVDNSFDVHEETVKEVNQS